LHDDEQLRGQIIGTVSMVNVCTAMLLELKIFALALMYYKAIVSRSGIIFQWPQARHAYTLFQVN